MFDAIDAVVPRSICNQSRIHGTHSAFGCRQPFAFRGNPSTPTYVPADFIHQQLKHYSQWVDHAYATVSKLEPKKDIQSLISVLLAFSRSLSYGYEAEVNTENGELDALAASDEACLFLFDHDDQRHDPALLGFFLTLLYNAYQKNLLLGQRSSIPLPKVIVDEDILFRFGKKYGQLLTLLGGVPVNTEIKPSAQETAFNASSMRDTLKAFCRDEANMFIFPEGGLSIQPGLTFSDRFQNGIGSLIRLAAKRKNV